MHSSLEEVLWPNIYLLRIVGIWPLPSKSNTVSRLFAYLRVFIQVICSVMMIMPIIYTLALTWGDISILADYGAILIMHFMMLFKLAYVIMRRRACHRVHKWMKEFWDISDEAKERKNFEYYATIAKTVTIVCVIAAYGDIILFMIPSIMNDLRYRSADDRTELRRTLPLDLSYGFDYQSSPFFELLFMIQMIQCFSAGITIIASDCTVMTVVLHFTGQFRLISARLREIGRHVYSARKLRDFGDMIVEIERCIEHHRRLIRVTEETSNLVGPMAFAQILTSGLIVCLSGLAMTKGNNGGVEIAKFALFFISINMQLLLWCWPGELLIQESGAIAQTVFFELPWYMLPTRVQRDLSFVILRSQKESKIASFLQVMCVSKLTEVFNAAGSYMALLRSIQD